MPPLLLGVLSHADYRAIDSDDLCIFENSRVTLKSMQLCRADKSKVQRIEKEDDILS